MLVPYLDTTQDARILRLKKTLGMTGYGVFWALLELSSGGANGETAADYEGLSFILGAEESAIRSVVYDFGLFTVDEERGVFWSIDARNYREQISEKKRRAARSRWNKNKTAENAPYTPAVETTGEGRQTTSEDDQKRKGALKTLDYDEETAKRPPNTSPGETFDEYYTDGAPSIAEDILTAWNDLFKGTAQEYRGLTLDAIAYNNLTQAIRDGYAVDEIKRAFRCAKDDTGFGWRLKDALKPDNIQLLLIKGDRNADTNRSGGAGDSAREWGIDFEQFTRRA